MINLFLCLTWRQFVAKLYVCRSPLISLDEFSKVGQVPPNSHGNENVRDHK
jgi:hypothetical protein